VSLTATPPRPLDLRAAARQPAVVLPLGFAFGVYAFAGITVPLLLLFAGGELLPRTVQKGPHTATAVAVVVDLALVALFGLQHSGMSRPSFKRFTRRWVPEGLERSVFVLMASLAIWVLCLGWRPFGGTLWDLHGVAGAVLEGGFWLGFVLVYAATLLLDHVHLLGLSQAWRAYVKREPEPTSDQLQVHGPYRLVRHPLMTGLLLVFWCGSTMTTGRLVWALALTFYILVGTVLEERDLVARFGDAYRRYRAEVPAFAPRPFRLNREDR
jgi:protein-S-isoprenylcysteine O-methyltransferase Ste14